MSHISTPIKVMIAIPVLFVGGTEIQVLSLTRLLVAAGHRVAVCCYYEYDQSIVKLLQKAGAEIILLELNRPDGRLGPYKIVELSYKVFQIFYKYRPDIVHVQYLTPGLIPILAARFAGISTVFATVHQSGRPYGWKEKCLIRTAAKLSTGFFCVSKTVEESWFGDSALWSPDAAKDGRKHFTIYNGVDCERIQRIVKETAPDDLKGSLGVTGRSVVGVVGRLREEKGHAWLLEAITDVVKAIPDATVLVVGDGPDRENLRQQVKDLDIASRIVWLGQRPPDEVYGLYAAMDVVVVPSLFEGFGLSAAEAMAAGRPVVGSHVDGLREVIIDNVTGYLVPAKDCEIMARRLVELLSNKQKAETMGEAGFHRVVGNFGMERFAASISAVYHFYAD